MFILINQFKKNLFILTAFLGFLGVSHFAYGNAEISAHFGKKFQDYGAWHLGVDALYRMSINESSSFGIGPRYRLYFKSASESISDETVSASISGKRNKHRLALLANYRFEMNSLFVGPLIAIDIWKRYSGNLSASGTVSGENGDGSLEITSSEFLWDKFTTQIGLEVGYKVTPNFLIKLEGGYDLLSFKECSLSASGSSGGQSETRNAEGECNAKFNGVYATVGLGYHF